MWLAMTFGVILVYCPLSLFESGRTLWGLDFAQIHMRHMLFAREAFSSTFSVPGWYPKEFLGTPFASNLQSFPWIPTRLVALLFDPRGSYAFSVNLSAVLAATFTFLYCRQVGLGRVASAAAGWTFACSGFYASRVTAGYLPLLEAYPALPLLVWLAERATQTQDEAPDRWRLAAMIGATAAVVLAGHPQLPAYAVGLAVAYTLWRSPTRSGLRVLVAMAMGIGTALAAWWPMLGLIRRSSRMLPLDPADTDVAFPLERLGAFFFPWKDGWPPSVNRYPHIPFSGYPNASYFWDTVVYTGVLPLLCALGLTLLFFFGKRPPSRWAFWALAGLAAVVTALPFAQEVLSKVPGIYLRSASRQLYVTQFALALGLGVACELWTTSRLFARAPRWVIAWALLAAHAGDLGANDRPFLWTRPDPYATPPDFEAILSQGVGDARVGIDYSLSYSVNRRWDDIGGFDSLLPASTYQGLLAVGDWPERLSVQAINAGNLGLRALEGAGVRYLVTRVNRPDLKPLAQHDSVRLYEVAHPASRVAFFPLSKVVRMTDPDATARLRLKETRLEGEMSVDPAELPEAVFTAVPQQAEPPPPVLDWKRTATDHLRVESKTSEPGYLRVLEAWDPGWGVEVDGVPQKVLRADGFLLSVFLRPGQHRVHFAYHTPGRTVGLVLGLSFLGLSGLFLWNAGRRKTVQGKTPAVA